MPSIAAISTAVPSFCYSNDEILQAGQTWLQGRDADLARFERFLHASQTETRHFVCSLGEILSFNGTEARARIFEQHGPAMGLESIRSAFVAANVDVAEIDVFLFTSCSIPVIPSIDGTLVSSSGLKPTVTRIPMYQHGCAGGIIGLLLANRFALSGQSVLLTTVELCSLGFHTQDFSQAQLVGSVIFGDGAATALVSPRESGLVFIDTQSILLPNSRHLMGYDILDDGAHLRLDKELPSFLAQWVPDCLQRFLQKNGLHPRDIPWWLFHPGGVKILNYLDDAFQLRPEQSRFARDVLRTVGNLSSASVLFVAAEFLRAKPYAIGDLVIMLGVGPGMTIELILFEVRS